MTFEEDIVERWYNARGYFTIRNIGYPSPVKRPGGKGRGEIDLLAVKMEHNKIQDKIWCEISVSVSSKFPFISKKEDDPSADEVYRLVKKFFSKGGCNVAIEHFESDYRCQNVTSSFANNIKDLLEDRLPSFKAKLIDFHETELGAEVRIKFEPEDPGIEESGVKTIELIEFPKVLEDFKRIFKEKGWRKKSFIDPTMRALQWFLLSEKL